MELWSKGLGKRVLGLALGERTAVGEVGGDLAVAGTMHAPTYWDYSVDLDANDVVEFIGLLEHPETVRFIATGDSLPRFIRTALANSVVFGARTLRMLAFGAPGAPIEAIALDDSDWTDEGEIDEDADIIDLADNEPYDDGGRDARA